MYNISKLSCRDQPGLPLPHVGWRYMAVTWLNALASLAIANFLPLHTPRHADSDGHLVVTPSLGNGDLALFNSSFGSNPLDYFAQWYHADAVTLMPNSMSCISRHSVRK